MNDRPEECQAPRYSGHIHIVASEYEDLFARVQYAESRLRELGEPTLVDLPTHEH